MPIEQALADIWVEVLKVEKVGVHDNFLTWEVIPS